MENKITVTAACCYVGDVETVGKNNFQKRTFVLKDQRDGSEYPTYLAFTLKKDKVNLVQPSDNGHRLTVTGYVESRDWTDPKTNKVKFFTDVTAVKVERVTEDGEDAASGVAAAQPDDAAIADSVQEDLPF